MTTKTLTVGDAAIAGLVVAPAVMGATDTAFEFANDGATLLIIENGSGASINVTISVPQTVDGLTVTAPVIAVAAGAMKSIGPFKPKYFNNSSGMVTATPVAAGTSIGGQAIRLPRA